MEMDRMGKITMLVLAVAVLLIPVCLSDYSDVADGEGTIRFLRTSVMS